MKKSSIQLILIVLLVWGVAPGLAETSSGSSRCVAALVGLLNQPSKFDASVLKRIEKAFPSLAAEITSGSIRPTRVYRGLQTSTEKYDPQLYFSGIKGLESNGEVWVSPRQDYAITYSTGPSESGLILEYEVPEDFYTVDRNDDPGMAGHISRKSMPDDRVFLRRIGIVHVKEVFRQLNGKEDKRKPIEWYTFDQAVKRGFIKQP
jgi:hypothetical protein